MSGQRSRIQARTPSGDLVTYAGYGALNAWWQLPVLRWVVRGRHVHDLGAGQLYWAHALAGLGASLVTAVDSIYKDEYSNELNQGRKWDRCVRPGVRIDARTFSDFYLSGPRQLDVAFVSWPCNTYGKTMGLELICQRARVVVYVGSNFDGTACGSPAFWQFMRTREVLAYAPGVPSSVIVFGPRSVTRAALLEEEAVGSYRESMGAPAWFPRILKGT